MIGFDMARSAILLLAGLGFSQVKAITLDIKDPGKSDRMLDTESNLTLNSCSFDQERNFGHCL